ncbi:MAG: hypothetical protein LBK95_01615 [Bifidobacteriaceae bacterium]|jgi:hypothetical protein|nr:hypothetical protein [Bifidobacteriaceae bacterium]
MEFGEWGMVVLAVAGAAPFVSLLGLCAYLVHKTGGTRGLRDLARVVEAWRRGSGRRRGR